MENIKSKYVAQQICSFINDDNFLLKLFAYSKSYQAKFNINLINYQKKYILTKCNEYDFNRIIYSIYKGRIDIKNDFLSKYNLNIKIDDIQNIIIEHFKTIKDEEIDIDILFPFLNILLKNDFFGKKVNVRIRISTYDEKEIINKINELKEQGVDVNFPSLKLL